MTEAGARNRIFFRAKWLQAAAMKGTSCVRRVRLRAFLSRMRSSLRLRIALEWLHDCCHLVLPCALICAGLQHYAAKFKRIVMAASRLLRTAAACVMLFSFAAGHRKSHWGGCIKAAILICQQVVSILALVVFLLKALLKSVSKSFFFRFRAEIP